jgi:glycosyltransferase involved in cell wall biosynthesis
MVDRVEPVTLELRLLLVCARVLTTQEDETEIRQILHQGIDWTLFAQEAIDRGLTSLAGHTLVRVAPDIVPGDILDAFRTIVDLTRTTNRALFDELARTIEATSFEGPVRAIEDARAAANDALAVNPNDAAAWRTLGRVLSGLTRYKQAIACFDRALALAPNNAACWRDCGSAMISVGASKAALANINIAPSLSTIATFLNSPEGDFEFDVGANTGQFEPIHRGKSDFAGLKDAGRATKDLIVEGWRFLPHSFAIVNQWQLLALLRRPNIALKVMDAPLLRSRWQRQDGLFEPQAEQALRSIETAKPGECADLTLRISWPFDFSPSLSRQTAVFGTSESQIIPRDLVPDDLIYEQLKRGFAPPDVTVVTPSRWSAEGFYKAGFKTEQVLIVPHGVDIDTFRPMPDLRGHIRSKIPVADGDFVFLAVGAMTGNKGIDLLLQAFAEISRRFPHARLVLKGMDPLYNSKHFLLKSLQTVSALDRQRIIDRLVYFGKSFRHRTMAMFYQAADAYVSPYRAEGFNIPVLEAAACGIPIICTGGGATDDFVTDAFARKIESRKLSHKVDDQEHWRLEPSVEHLIALMSSAIEDDSWRKQAAEAAPLHARTNYTWDCAVDVLVRKLLG